MGEKDFTKSGPINFNSDIDIDFGDRSKLLKVIKHIPASIVSQENAFNAHNTGVYVTSIPTDPETGRASIDYKIAEQRGYLKIDFLNVNLYQQIRNEDHLVDLMNAEPPWHKLYDPEFCGQLIHIGNHYNTLIKMPEAVNSIPRLAMFLAVIRPAKKHLIGKTWKEVAQTVWDKPVDGSYGYKKPHGISYAHLVSIHMNLLNS